ncbi:hypothetical protein O9X98_06060 [Agrobacterium salinitolerans]|nr:hypothetical protein [Agrobacterium salinitolerans]
MNIHEFEAACERDRKLLEQGIAPIGVDSCSCCSKPLQTFLTGREYLGDGSVVCTECYFDKLGAHVEEHPIGARRGRFSRRNETA